TSGASITSLSGSGASYTVTVATGSGDGAIRLDLVDDDSIADAAGNPLGGAGAGTGSVTGPTYTIDKTAPVVSAITRLDATPTNAASVRFAVAFSEAVSGVDAGDFTLTTSGTSGASIASVSGSGSSYTVTVATGTGDGLIRLDLVDDDSIIDAAGNVLGGPGTGNGSVTGPTYTIDKTAPVVSIQRPAQQANPTSTQPILFAVRFSEPVIGFGVS